MHEADAAAMGERCRSALYANRQKTTEWIWRQNGVGDRTDTYCHSGSDGLLTELLVAAIYDFMIADVQQLDFGDVIRRMQ